MIENLWPSKLWQLPCVEELLKDNFNALTGKPLELQRRDQCQYGLVDQLTGFPPQKATGLALSSEFMKIRFRLPCNGEHEHEPIIGGTRSTRSERWPEQLCQQMAAGLYDEMVYRTLKLAFPAELIYEENESKCDAWTMTRRS